MITLYELHWSHYCEKVRLALRYMRLDWDAVPIDAFRKTELRAHPLPAHLPNPTVPAIHDALTGTFVMDSTPILRYLADKYPDAPQLFPGGAENRAAIDSKLLEFDSSLSLPARRFAYTQVILECPGLLPELFLRHRANGFFCLPGIRRIARAVLGILLTKRFDLHLSERLGMYEALEEYLLDLAVELEDREFVVGECFSAADLALAAQLRPLTIVPFFSEHPRLQTLFERHRRVVGRWASGGEPSYQRAVAAARERRAPMRRRLRPVTATLPFAHRGNLADNDQRPVWTWGIAAMPYHYWHSLRRNKVREANASSAVR
jgi:glutathione S-transferase